MAEEVLPKNILMMGPTGVGKTEIARRLARLSKSPFVKIEATKYTEVGYVGRDVDSMIRDLVEMAVEMVREEKTRMVAHQAEQNAEDRLLNILMPPQQPEDGGHDCEDAREAAETPARWQARREAGGDRGQESRQSD